MKNRFGAVNELGVFAMTDTGMKEVKNPSAIFFFVIVIGPAMQFIVKVLKLYLIEIF